MSITLHYRIGHSAYSGANRMHICSSYQEAVIELLKRKVALRRIHQALQQAKRGSHATMTTRDGLHVIEAITYQVDKDGYRL